MTRCRSYIGVFASLGLAAGGAIPALAAQTELTGIAQLSARGGHACVVTSAGGVKCWGSNSSGQLGGGPDGFFRPVATDVVGISSGAVAVAASTSAHTCAVMSGGGVKCWGANDKGQLGDGTTTKRLTPVDVVGLPWSAVAVTAGDSHTCARSSAGAVACWGANQHGQVGDGTTAQRTAPTPVTGLASGVTSISAAINHSCALMSGGGVKCWGANESGQLGDGTTTSRPAPVDALGVAGASSLATGGYIGPSYFALTSGRSCAVTSSGTRCWNGAGASEVAGVAAGATSLTVGGAFLDINLVELIYRTIGHACVVTPAGGAQCWGDNYCGMVGSATGSSCNPLGGYSNLPPTMVEGLSTGVASVSAARIFTCALLTSGGVKCFGSGYGATPAAVMEGTNPQQIVFQAPPFPGVYINGSGTLGIITRGGSGSPVVFASLTPATCSVAGAVVTGIAAGTCTIAANQAGSEYFDPAPQATNSFPIDPHYAQTITFGPAPTLVVNGVGTVTATASSGLPVSLSAASGSNCSISGSTVTGTGVGTCQVLATQFGNATYAPAQGAVLEINVTANTGVHGLVVHRSGGGSGTVTSGPGGINCGTACAANFANATIVTLTPTAAAGSTFVGWSGACTGAGSCQVTMNGLKHVNAGFGADVPRLANISTRGQVQSADNVLIGGFIIGGTANKTVVVRARGPSLAAQGVAGVLPDPYLTIVNSSGQVVDANDGWLNSSGAGTVQALGFAPASNLEPALLLTLAPGAYTAVVSRSGASAAGVGIVEIFEVDEGAAAPLANIATRGLVLTGEDVLIGGFIIQGNGPQTVVVRARGPSLTSQGVSGALENTVLTIKNQAGTTIATNDDWQAASNASTLQASGFAPSDSRESAILITLQPGAYTAIVTGQGNTTGIAIVEVFRVTN